MFLRNFIIALFFWLVRARAKHVIGSVTFREGPFQLVGHMGTPRALLHQPIGQNMSQSILKSTLGLRKSTTAKFKGFSTLDINGIKVLIEENSENFFLDNSNNFVNFNICFPRKTEVNQHGLAFGFSIQKEEFSLTHMLKKIGAINRLKYTFVPTSFSEGKIFFGEVDPSELKEIKNKDERGSCQVSGIIRQWGCLLESVVLENPSNNTFKYYNKYATFQANIEYSIFPSSFLDYLKETFPEDFGNCTFTQKKNVYGKFIRCDRMNKNKVYPKLHFKFIGVMLSIDVRDLFTYFLYKGYYSKFVVVPGREREFVFGSEFLKEVISSYDYEKGAITFFSQGKVKVTDLSGRSPVQTPKESNELLLRFILLNTSFLVVMAVVNAFIIRIQSYSKLPCVIT